MHNFLKIVHIILVPVRQGKGAGKRHNFLKIVHIILVPVQEGF